MESGNEVPVTVVLSVNEVVEDKNVSSPKKNSSSKKGKLGKNSPNTGTFGRTPRPGLFHSLSLPAKTPRAVDQPTSSTSASSRSFSVNKPSSGLKALKTARLDKEDDGASSTPSPNARRRSSGSGFAHRSDERAERRKQFNSKIEEKVHAKEVEKSNLQAKSKESQEKEIKKLRKSLTFKATPLPSFYKEPPPKPQLKKIPTTRPVSPKLGRSKSSVGAVSKALEHIEIAGSPRDQAMSPRLNNTNRDKNTAAFKQPNKKSLKKGKVLNAEAKDEKVCDEGVQESQVGVGCCNEVEESCLEVDKVEESGVGSSSSSANQDMTAVDVVGG